MQSILIALLVTSINILHAEPEIPSSLRTALDKVIKLVLEHKKTDPHFNAVLKEVQTQEWMNNLDSLLSSEDYKGYVKQAKDIGLDLDRIVKDGIKFINSLVPNPEFDGAKPSLKHFAEGLKSRLNLTNADFLLSTLNLASMMNQFTSKSLQTNKNIFTRDDVKYFLRKIQSWMM